MPRSRRPPSPPAHSYGGRVPARLGPFLAMLVVFTLTPGPDTARPRASAAGGLPGPRPRRRAHRPDRPRLPHAAPGGDAEGHGAAPDGPWGRRQDLDVLLVRGAGAERDDVSVLLEEPHVVRLPPAPPPVQPAAGRTG